MAVCSTCHKEMTNGATQTCVGEYIAINGKAYLRSREHFEEPSGRCHDCNIVHGGLHHPGCDVERCPNCGGQFIGCSCRAGTIFSFVRDSLSDE